jgi:hypothetical protein
MRQRQGATPVGFAQKNAAPFNSLVPVRQSEVQSCPDLPDVAGVGTDHLLSGLAAKGLGEVGAVLHRAIGPVFTRRMRIRFGQQA